jgi:peptidoglycan/xylan/chitin deacetylase (PgdA/CDA1 family)
MRAASVLHRKQVDPNRRTARMSRALLSQAADLVAAGRGCCFTFHRAARAADWPAQPDRGFYVDLHYLEKLIGHLQRTGWDIVSMDEATSRTARPGSGRFVNFSIDDCYRDTAELVVPLFRRLRAPVTLYVTTGIPDGTLRLRNAGLETIVLNEQRVTDGDEIYDLRTPAAKRTAFAALSRKWEHPDGDAAYEHFCARHGYSADTLDEQHRVTWTMLRCLCEDDLVEIGAHTMSHPRIASLDPDTALGELVGCRERLETALGRKVRHFAFPFGRRNDCGERDFALARRAGFASAATTRKGLVAPGSDPFRLPRNTLNGEHRKLSFAYAHLSGASGAAARMLHRD